MFGIQEKSLSFLKRGSLVLSWWDIVIFSSFAPLYYGPVLLIFAFLLFLGFGIWRKDLCSSLIIYCLGFLILCSLEHMSFVVPLLLIIGLLVPFVFPLCSLSLVSVKSACVRLSTVTPCFTVVVFCLLPL